MADLICDSCGERNPPGTEFCLSCNAYLAWERTMAPGLPGPGQSIAEAVAAQRVMNGPAGAGTVPPRTIGVADRPTEALRVVADTTAVTLTPGRDPVVLTVTVFNASRIVDRYAVDIPDAPPWLKLAADELRLAPSTDDKIRATLRIPAPPLIAAGQHRLTLRVRSATTADAVWTAPLILTVGVIDAPVVLTLDPVLVRVRDMVEGRARVLLDNRNSNRPLPLTLAGSDSEAVLRYRFSPPQLVIPPMGTAVALLQVAGPPPPPGQDVTRQFTITGTGGVRDAVMAGTFVQGTSAQVLKIAVEPARQVTRDTGGVEFRLTAEHPGGAVPVRLALQGSDSERLARFTFTPPVLDLPPGGVARVRVHVELPQPDAGIEATRELSFLATSGDGKLTAMATATVQQHTSPPALNLRLEPAVIRVRDSTFGHTQLIADNRTGVRPVRLSLTGTDPELAIRFRFQAPMLELAAGEILAVGIDLAAPAPEAGSEVSRPFTIRAGDAQRSSDVAGTFTQTSSEPAMSDLAVRLEPPVYRLHGRRTGSLLVVADNRSGEQPVQIYWQGSDAEGQVRFGFEPAGLVVPPGGTAASRVTVTAPSPGGGAEKTRSITISASDGRQSVETSGSFIQSGDDRRPLWSKLLTLVGALLMIAGVFLPWLLAAVSTDGTERLTQPETGLELSLVEFARFTGINLSRLNFNVAALKQVPQQFISAGIVVLVFAGMQLFGLTGKTGRLIRTGAGLSFAFVLAFVMAMVFKSGGWTPGAGIFLVVLGAVAGFAGGLLARK